ncbi:MAG: S-methyl-5-thioribose-1-phosphate isomerase [Syntrophales bacterium]|jgi:methylthioribose-1-phosphate isomerase|nr:S-methyl-5-thioribose-1-phosphate isomerase [Syntrophales bacterium]
MEVRPIIWRDDAVVLIDQNALPLQERELLCREYGEVVAAIKDLTVRGAPAIGIAAAFGIALGMRRLGALPPGRARSGFQEICGAFARSRPTARNLFWAIERMGRRFDAACAEGTAGIGDALLAEARAILEEDVAANRRLGRFGSPFLRDGDAILTHCNAGALATGGYGTALGVIRAAHEEGKRISVFVDETRPVLQGARLTAWELRKEGIPFTLVADNMAGTLMKQGRIQLVIVGADRIAANGDAANKIGTYPLAVLARAHGIPFYVAAPRSTIDLSLGSGDEIPIEERNPEEILSLRGVRIAEEGIDVYNPAFDVTPASLVTAIITEAGVANPPSEAALRELCSRGRSR